MRKLIGKFFIAIVVLFVLYLLVLWTEWLPLSTPAGKKAVAIMTSPLPPLADKENAFSEAWLFPYDIPESDKAKIMAADIAKFSKYDGSYDSVSAAEGKYPKFDDTENLLCKPKTENCLDKARSNLDNYHKLFSEHEKLSKKAIAFAGFDRSRSKFQNNLATPLGNYGPIGSWQLTTAAYWHVQGKTMEAVDLTCRAAKSWRGFAENSQGLVEQMVGLAFYANATRLLAEQLSESPKATLLPSSCTEAYLPVTPGKFPICQSIKLEYQLLQAASASVKAGESAIAGDAASGKWSDKVAALWFNQRVSNERFAMPLAAECTEDAEIVKTIDNPDPGVWNGLSYSELAFNPIGGILTSIASANYTDYRGRMQNLSLTQEAMLAVLAHRGMTELQAGEVETSSGTEKVRFNKQANAFEVDLFRSPRETQLLSLPLAGSRQAE